MSRRTIALIAAVVLAAIATVALVSYVQNAHDKNVAGAALVKVFVAKETIPQGVSGDSAISQGLVNEDNREQRTVPPGAITSLDQIKGLVAATNILPNEVITTDRFVQPGQAGGGLPVPTGRQAVSVEVDIPPGVAGFIRQGDTVSLIGHTQIKALTVGTSNTPRPIRICGVQLAAGAVAKYFVQNVEVLAVGQRVVTTTENGEQQSSTTTTSSRILLTLAVTPTDAERVVFMIKEGDITFTIVPKNQAASRTPGRCIFNEFPR
jgi:pilus assembly protein CpaB